MKVIILQDRNKMTNSLVHALKAESFVVDVVNLNEKGVNHTLINACDAILLLTHRPHTKGMSVIKRIRGRKHAIPIIIISDEKDIEIKINMLKLCDDYIIKKCSLREIIARLRAVLRRGDIVHADTLSLDDLIVHVESCEVIRGKRPIKLTNKEFALLEYLIRHAGKVLSRGILLESVWDMNADPFTNTVDVHIMRLRKKIDRGFIKELIHTIPGRGYKLSL